MISLIEEGDLFKVPGCIGHGVNCAGAMGKGIALEFKKRWPGMYDSYKSLCLSGKFGPGDLFAYQDPKTLRWIYNLGTQKSWKEKAKPEYLKSALEKTVRHLKGIGEKEITFPKICAGLGGLDFLEVIQVFNSIDSSGVHLKIIKNSAHKT